MVGDKYKELLPYIQQETEVETIQQNHNHGDETRYYREKTNWSFSRNYLYEAVNPDWYINGSEFDTEAIETDQFDTETLTSEDFDTEEIDMISMLAEQIQSGEIDPPQEVITELSERALALVPHADKTLPVTLVERTLLCVLVLNPDPQFRQAVDEKLRSLYIERPGINSGLMRIVEGMVKKTAEVAANPDDYIDPSTLEHKEAIPSVDRILETANTLVITRLVAQAVQRKKFAEETEAA